MVIEEVTVDEIRKTKNKRGDFKKTLPTKQADKDASRKPEAQDPLVVNDPWVMHKKQQKESQAVRAPLTRSTPASSSSALPQGATATLDPRVTALTQRVEQLEGDTRELHGKVDGLDGKVAGMENNMNTQFSEVLRLLGSIHDKKRAAPDQ